MKLISLYLDEEVLEWIDSKYKNRSDFIRTAIAKEYLKHKELEKVRK